MGVSRAAKALAQEIVDRLSEITVKVQVELQDIVASGGSRQGGSGSTAGRRKG